MKYLSLQLMSHSFPLRHCAELHQAASLELSETLWRVCNFSLNAGWKIICSDWYDHIHTTNGIGLYHLSDGIKVRMREPGVSFTLHIIVILKDLKRLLTCTLLSEEIHSASSLANTNLAILLYNIVPVRELYSVTIVTQTWHRRSTVFNLWYM